MASDVDEQQPPERPPRRPRSGPPAKRRSAGPATVTRGRRGDEPRPAARPPSRRPPPPPSTEPDGPAAPKSPKKQVVLLSVLTVVVVLLAGLAFVLRGSAKSKGPAPAAPVGIPMTTFTDRQTGATLQYPRSWKQVDVPNATYRLVLDGGNNVGMTFRVFNTDVATTATNLANVKTVTDGIVSSNKSVQILKQQAVQLNGMVGYYYFYTFTDDAGLSAVHAHYFLFQGQKMNMIVFQASPDEFTRLADTFDKVAGSFHSDPNVVLSGVTPVSIPPITTTIP